MSRKDLVSRFGISEPAATKDLSLYGELAPGMLRYDLRKKCYAHSDGNPIFEHNVEQALFSLLGERAIALNSEHGKRVSGWVSSSIKRTTPLPLVATITRCIYQNRKMTAQYGSMSSGQRIRQLSPLAMVYDGLRWHVRCFNHEANDYRDYNLTRFSTVSAEDPSDVRLDDDAEWNTQVQLRLVPHPKALHPETIRLDYRISEDALVIKLRASLVGYFLRQWHVDFSDSAAGNPRAQHLYLENKADLLSEGVSRWALES